MSQIFFCLQPGILALVRLPATNPAKQLTFLLFISAEGTESPLPFWGPSQSLGFYLPPLPVSGDLRLLSTNTCWYPLSNLHSFLTDTFLTGCHCSFQREDSINLISIVSVGYHVTIYIVEKRKISYFVLARYLIQHWISPNQDDISYSARTFISG